MKIPTLLRVLVLISSLYPSILGAQSCSRKLQSHGLEYKVWEDPSNSRSDTIDIIHTVIDLDMTQMNLSQIKARCQQNVHMLLPSDSIHFDLQSLTVDSVKLDNALVEFEYASPDLFVVAPTTLAVDSDHEVDIYYHGDPVTDPTFGGFYHANGYAYNLGVGFAANPHTFGRAWFPCFDNFVERSTYEVHVLTNNNRHAYCGGLRLSEETVGQDSLYSHWSLDRTIPSYLASVAVSDYTHVNWEYETLSGETIPVWLAAKPADTLDMKLSMSNLINWLQYQENHFGEYRWPRVGYVAVPFNGGAMEHACNIAYPLFAIDGTSAYETLYAHELAHHWWGDLVTCSTEEDMWLNEGWASFSEALYMEAMYGSAAYEDYVRANHKDVLLHAHQDDGGRYPVSGIPHEITYGSHVYNKGAVMVHNLRTYMGDTDFFAACQAFTEAYQYQAISSETLCDYFQTFTTADLTAFFDSWIFTPGFPEARIVNWEQTAPDAITISLEQNTHYRDEWTPGLPLQVWITDWAGHEEESTAIMADRIETFIIPLSQSFDVKNVLINKRQQISMAVLNEGQWIAETGNANFNYAEAILDVNDLGGNDSIFVWCENHFATANEPYAVPFTNIVLSPDRWWMIDGQFEGAHLDADFKYYGSSTSSNYFDPLFFELMQAAGKTENDMVLFYRPDGAATWTPWNSFEIQTQGSATNYTGRITAFDIAPGQYAWGFNADEVGITELPNDHSVVVYIDPQAQLHLRCDSDYGHFTIYDAQGKQLRRVSSRRGEVVENISDLASGTYLIRYCLGDTTQTFHITK
ncbi:MAG: M1 family aminopeptidase [Flavobacteriales bacterium]